MHLGDGGCIPMQTCKLHSRCTIDLDSPRPGADGHDAKLRVEGQGAGLVGEAMLHSLVESEELLLELLALRVGTLPPEPKLHHLVPAAATAAGCARPRRS